jgi:hypothetical protein
MELNFQGMIIMIISISSTVFLCMFCIAKLLKKNEK